MAINPNTDFTAGQVLTADQQNRFPRGVMAQTQRSTVYLPDTTITDLFTLTFTAVANRIYKYTLNCPSIDASGAIVLTMSLTDNSNNVLNQCSQILQSGGPRTNLDFTTYRTESAGSVTRKIRGVTNTGNGAMFGSTTIGFFTIEDIGPA